MPQLAEDINSNLPYVPQRTSDELQEMLDDLIAVADQRSWVVVPVGYEEAEALLREATGHMVDRINFTSKGIVAARESGTAASLEWFEQGRNARDAYRKAIANYHDSLPSG